MAEATGVRPEGRISPGDVGIWTDAQMEVGAHACMHTAARRAILAASPAATASAKKHDALVLSLLKNSLYKRARVCWGGGGSVAVATSSHATCQLPVVTWPHDACVCGVDAGLETHH